MSNYIVQNKVQNTSAHYLIYSPAWRNAKFKGKNYNGILNE